MLAKRENEIIYAIRRSAHPLTGDTADFNALIKAAGDSRFLLIGEASHGTHEFYRIRAQITKRLITEEGFNTVAVEADWPDAYRVNQYVRFEGGDEDAIDALGGFQRFLTWMWRNADVLDFIGWVRKHNEHCHAGRAGFYGLDLYRLHASMRAVLDSGRAGPPPGAQIEDCCLGSQFASGRCARHRDGPQGRTQSWPTGPHPLWQRSIAGRLHHLFGLRDRGIWLGQSRGAQACAPRPAGKLRSAPSPNRSSEFSASSAKGR